MHANVGSCIPFFLLSNGQMSHLTVFMQGGTVQPQTLQSLQASGVSFVSDLKNWHAHVDRRHDPHAWSPHLLSWRGNQWLSIQRLWNSAHGESRTNTRVFRGKVHRQWEEGLKIIQDQ